MPTRIRYLLFALDASGVAADQWAAALRRRGLAPPCWHRSRIIEMRLLLIEDNEQLSQL